MHWPLPDRPDLREELLTAYDRPGYHDQRHLAEVLDRLAELGCDSAPEWDAVWLAAWFHDSVCAGERDDEERSALWAETALDGPVASEVGRLSTNYAFLPGNKLFAIDPAVTSAYLSPPSFPYGGAGLVMSARDYDRFLHMLQDYGELDGVRIMKPETAKLAMSNLLPAGVEFGGVAGATGGTAGPKMGFGAGGSVVLEDKANSMGADTYGWGGAAGTAAWVNPVKKIRGTIMVNYFPADKWPIRDETVKALVSDMQRFRAK